MARSEIGLWIAIAFLIGAGFAGLGASITLPIVISGLLVAVLVITVFQFPWKLLCAIGIAFFLGLFYYHFYFNLTAQRRMISFGKSISVSGMVVSEPREASGGLNFSFALSEPYRGIISVINLSSRDIFYHERLTLSGVIYPPAIEREAPKIVSPRLETRGGVVPSIRGTLIAFKNNLIDQFAGIFTSDESAFLGGITLGARNSFSKELHDAMVASGTIHLVALSGYNIIILINALTLILKRLMGKRARFYVITIAIVLFTAMVGAEASIVRAAIMAFLLLLASETGRTYLLQNAIVFTAVLMTLINPGVLFDLGFLLSFMSLLGIVYLEPVLSAVFRIDKKESIWPSMLLTTVSAQLGVLPVILYNFGTYSLLSILANMLILPLIPFMMFLGFLFIGVHAIVTPFAFVIRFVLGPLTSYVLFVINFFAKVQLPIQGNFNSPLFVIGYYALACVAIFEYHRYNRNQS